MPWLLVSPGHQHPRYWLCRIGKFLSFMRKDFNYLCHVSVDTYQPLFDNKQAIAIIWSSSQIWSRLHPSRVRFILRKCRATVGFIPMNSGLHLPRFLPANINKQRVLMHRHQGWNVRHGLCHIYMRYLYIYELFIAFVCFVVCSLLQRDGIFGVLCRKWQARESTGMFGNLMAIYYIMPQFIQNHSRFVMLMKTCMIS